MAREPIRTWCFAVVVVRWGERFLLVQEAKHQQMWYLPAGRVEQGESYGEAAVRETLEESGIAVRPVGIIRIEHTPKRSSARLRVVYLAEPEGDTTPKNQPDGESLGAVWVTLEELDHYSLRGPEVRDLFRYIAGGRPVAPLSILDREGKSFCI